MAFLTLDNLSKRYGDAVAVDDLTLSIQPGEFLSLLGPSGCGKTTTLQMIAGFVEVSSGRILLDGQDITHAKPASRGLGVVFQSYALFPHMTVRDNVAFGLRMRKVAGAELARRVEEALGLVHLGQHAERYPRELSGGQRQRVWVAMLLAQQTPIMLLDEPTTFLDIAHQYELLELLRAFNEAGKTVVTVLHDLNQAARYANHLIVMKDGHVHATGTPEEVLTAEMVQGVYGLPCIISPDPVTGTPTVVPLSRSRAEA